MVLSGVEWNLPLVVGPSDAVRVVPWEALWEQKRVQPVRVHAWWFRSLDRCLRTRWLWGIRRLLAVRGETHSHLVAWIVIVGIVQSAATQAQLGMHGIPGGTERKATRTLAAGYPC